MEWEACAVLCGVEGTLVVVGGVASGADPEGDGKTAAGEVNADEAPRRIVFMSTSVSR